MESEISGTLDGDDLVVDRIDISGEGSGTTLHDHLYEAFTKSTGKLTAKMIWEGGDSISKLRVVDGVVSNKDIEL